MTTPLDAARLVVLKSSPRLIAANTLEYIAGEYAANGDFALSYAVLDRLRQMGDVARPDYDNALVRVARKELAGGRSSPARRHLDQARKQISIPFALFGWAPVRLPLDGPQHREFIAYLADSYVEGGWWSEALAMLEAYATRYEGSDDQRETALNHAAGVLARIAGIARCNGRIGVVQRIDSLMVTVTGRTRFLLRQGECELSRGDTTAAVALLTRATEHGLRTTGPNGDLFQDIVASWSRADRMEDAVRVLRSNPRDAMQSRGLTAVVEAYARLGAFREARAWADSLDAQSRAGPLAAILVACARRQSGDPACQVMDRFAHRPGDPRWSSIVAESHLGIAQIVATAGFTNLARVHLREGLALLNDEGTAESRARNMRAAASAFLAIGDTAGASEWVLRATRFLIESPAEIDLHQLAYGLISLDPLTRPLGPAARLAVRDALRAWLKGFDEEVRRTGLDFL